MPPECTQRFSEMQKRTTADINPSQVICCKNERCNQMMHFAHQLALLFRVFVADYLSRDNGVSSRYFAKAFIIQ